MKEYLLQREKDITSEFKKLSEDSARDEMEIKKAEERITIRNREMLRLQGEQRLINITLKQNHG